MSISHKRKEDCCGCNACAEICPVKCITMEVDSKGFLYPQIDENKCIECGACENVCPLLKKDKCLKYPIKAYAAWNKDSEKRKYSSSGGAAYVFANYILKQGGIVYGCASDGIKVRHIRIDRIDELDSLKGSKYVQSDVRNIYSQIRNDLKKGIQVLFIGTPCQIAGLKFFLKIIPENLLMVDLICHGVPSSKMLKEHVSYVTDSASIESVSFRQGNNFILEIKSDKKYYKKPYIKDLYYRGFFYGITYRLSCYHCPFAGSSRVGDITIGDFWGLKNTNELPTKVEDGISLLLPCTNKGLMLLKNVDKELYLLERSIDEAIMGNSQLQNPVLYTNRSKIFNLLYPMTSFDNAVLLSIIDQKIAALIKRILKK